VHPHAQQLPAVAVAGMPVVPPHGALLRGPLLPPQQALQPMPQAQTQQQVAALLSGVPGLAGPSLPPAVRIVGVRAALQQSLVS
jgi:hypothetical protein